MSDLIRKYDVLKICEEKEWNGADDYYSISANKIAEKVKELPTLDAVPVRHGHWKHDAEGFSYCSECGNRHVWDYNFCPDCGARMVESDE